MTKTPASSLSQAIKALLVVGLALFLLVAFVRFWVTERIAENAAAQDPDCQAIEDDAWGAFSGWLEQPENWLSPADIAALELDEEQEFEAEILDDLGCAWSDSLEDVVSDYTATDDYETVWPAGCIISDAPGREVPAQVVSAAQNWVNAHPEVKWSEAGDSAMWEEGVDKIMGDVGCELLIESWHRETVDGAMKDLVSERERLLTEEHQADGSIETWDVEVDVDVPDVNPFYCSWSFRGGFNCGARW